MKLYGYTLDKAGIPIVGASVELKDERFQTVCEAISGEDGYFEIHAEDRQYPFLTVVKDYAVNYLEFWCQNLDLRQDLRIDASFDKLEIYGLHVFSVKGGFNACMVYFRPMSLVKALAGETDIAPDIQKIQVKLDGKEARILCTNPVKEFAGGSERNAYLLHVENPNADRKWNRLDVEIWDAEGHFGAAAIFHE